MRIRKYLIIFTLSWWMMLSAIGDPIFAAQASYRAIFSWEVPLELRQQISEYALLVDDEIVFDHITDIEADSPEYTLVIDNTNNQYQLFFEQLFDVGQHYWLIIGADAQENAIFRTEPEVFSVESNGWQQTSGLVGGLLTTLLDSSQLLWRAVVHFLPEFLILLLTILLLVDLVLVKCVGLYIRYSRGSSKTKRSGLVFDSQTNNGVSFALLTIKGTNDAGETIVKTRVSDVDGIYAGIVMPPGEYELTVQRQGFVFPTRKSRPSLMPENHYYKGESIKIINHGHIVDPMIPMDRAANLTKMEKNSYNWQREFWQFWQIMKRHQSVFEWLIILLAWFLLWWQVSWWLVIIVIIYGLIVIGRLIFRLRQPTLYGLVTDENGLPISGAIIEVYAKNAQQHFESSTLTDQDGSFAFDLRPGQYYLRAKKNGFLSPGQTRTVNADQLVEVRRGMPTTVLTLQSLPQLTEDFLLKQD